MGCTYVGSRLTSGHPDHYAVQAVLDGNDVAERDKKSGYSNVAFLWVGHGVDGPTNYD